MKHADWKQSESDKTFIYTLNDKGVNHFDLKVQGAHISQEEKEEIANMIVNAPKIAIEAEALRARVAELEAENTWMYGAIMEAADMGSVRCQLELQRIARKDAGVTPKPPQPMNTHHIGTPALSRYAAAQIAKAEAEKRKNDEREGRK